MDKQANVEFLLDGIDEGAKACMDLAEVFVDVGDLVAGKRDAISDETIRRFRQVADIVDPPPGKDKSDDRQRVIASIREARAAVDAFEKNRNRHLDEDAPRSERTQPRKTRLRDGSLVMLLGYVVIIIAVLILFLTRHRDAASLVSFAGTPLWTFSLLAWVVFFDSRRRWPGASASQRLLNVITFRRD